MSELGCRAAEKAAEVVAKAPESGKTYFFGVMDGILASMEMKKEARPESTEADT